MSVTNLLRNCIFCTETRQIDPIRAFCTAALESSSERLHVDNESSRVRAAIEELEAELEEWSEKQIYPWSQKVREDWEKISGYIGEIRKYVPKETELEGVFDWGDIYSVEDILEVLETTDNLESVLNHLWGQVRAILTKMLDEVGRTPGAEDLIPLGKS